VANKRDCDSRFQNSQSSITIVIGAWLECTALDRSSRSARAATPSASPPAASPSADPRGGDDSAFFSDFDFFSLPDLLFRAPLADEEEVLSRAAA
jgi:hypothetical protein